LRGLPFVCGFVCCRVYGGVVCVVFVLFVNFIADVFVVVFELVSRPCHDFFFFLFFSKARLHHTLLLKTTTRTTTQTTTRTTTTQRASLYHNGLVAEKQQDDMVRTKKAIVKK